ncbi:MAG: serine/threonine-protein kinase [Myxococcota bacterium]|nr:serine/threonine-protein kinase [Myxococcota bacterium]
MAIRLGQFQLLMPLGAGGSANVYLARDLAETDNPRLIALKILLPHLTRRRDSLSMFFSEARIASKIEHKNVVSIFGLGKSDNVYCLAQEYVFGENFTDILLESGRLNKPLTVGAILRVIAQVASGLDAAHRLTDDEGKSLSLVHRDVTGHNIMLSFDGHTKLMDFGIAKASDRGFETQTGIVKGKFPYMSPEQTLGKKLDSRSDIFSLGIIAWEALTGEPLFTGHSPGRIMKAIREKPIPRPSKVSEQLSPVLDSLVMRALQRDPARRYQHAEEFQHAINEVIAHAGLEIGPETIRKELKAIYAEVIAAREKVLEQARVGEDVHQELSALFETTSIYDCQIPQMSKSDVRFDMVSFGQRKDTKKRPNTRTSSVHATSNPEFVDFPAKPETLEEAVELETEEVTLAEAQNILVSMEEEPVSQPLVDIHDLIEGWGSTTNEPLNVRLTTGEFESETPEPNTEIALGMSKVSRVRTQRERSDQPGFSTGRVFQDTKNKRELAGDSAPINSHLTKNMSAPRDSSKAKRVQDKETKSSEAFHLSASNIMVSILMFLVGVLLVYWLKQLR